MSNSENQNEIIALWNELKVKDVHFVFSCGGDSMNDTSIVINGLDGSTIYNDELEQHIDSEVYSRVEFYVNSDGHYIGERGTVYVTLNSEGDDLEYEKCSQSEWSERTSSIVEVELTSEEADFIKDKVFNINGGDGDFVVNYKRDLILTDNDEAVGEQIKDKIQETCRDYEPESYDGELQDWFTFTTNSESGSEIRLEGNILFVELQKEVTVTTDGD